MEQNHKEIWALAEHAAALDPDSCPDAVRDALRKSLFDSLAVGLAGSRTPEIRALVAAWPMPAGPATVWGTPHATDLNSAAILNGTALCSLELDEGNKFARGHPGAHILPALIAEAQRLKSTGAELLAAYLAGYEVATRFARAIQPIAGLHPHGNWGAIGSAVAITRLNGGDATAIAQAIDAAGGLALAGPFSSALVGSFVRNTWVGIASANGAAAARLVAAGLGTVDGTPYETFGRLLATMDPALLVEDLGQRFELLGGYYKRHASCNYTHPPADAALALYAEGLRADDVQSVAVTTHKLAVPLANMAPATRLAAMFSIPHVIAVALRDGEVGPAGFSPDALVDPGLARLRDRITVAGDAGIDARLPHERVARVTVTLANGTTREVEVPNAIGDAAHHPFDFDGLVGKAAGLIGAEKAACLAGAVTDLHRAPDPGALTRLLTETTD